MDDCSSYTHSWPARWAGTRIVLLERPNNNCSEELPSATECARQGDRAGAAGQPPSRPLLTRGYTRTHGHRAHSAPMRCCRAAMRAQRGARALQQRPQQYVMKFTDV